MLCDITWYSSCMQGALRVSGSVGWQPGCRGMHALASPRGAAASGLRPERPVRAALGGTFHVSRLLLGFWLSDQLVASLLISSPASTSTASSSLRCR